MSSEEQKSGNRGLLKVYLIFIVVLSALASLQTAVTYSNRQTEVLMVEKISASRQCWAERRKWPWRLLNSSETQASGYNCGYILSDHGSFELPRSRMFGFFGHTREEMFDAMVVGCRYEVTVSGPGMELRSQAGLSNHNRVLRQMKPIGECPPNVDT